MEKAQRLLLSSVKLHNYKHYDPAVTFAECLLDA